VCLMIGKLLTHKMVYLKQYIHIYPLSVRVNNAVFFPQISAHSYIYLTYIG